MLAGLERNETTIQATVTTTRDDAHLLDLSVEANFNHGVPLSQSDKQRLAKLRYNDPDYVASSERPESRHRHVAAG